MQAIVRLCAEHGVAIIPHGGCTGLAGAARTEAGQLIVATTRLNRIEAVLPSGAVVSDLKRVVKANEGYDIKQLLVGAEGTPGIISPASCWRSCRPMAKRRRALVTCPDANGALAVFRRLHATLRATLVASEIMWFDHVRVEVGGLAAPSVVGFAPDGHVLLLVDLAGEHAEAIREVLEEILADAVLAKNADERNRMWVVREERGWEIDKVVPHGFWLVRRLCAPRPPEGLCQQSRRTFEDGRSRSTAVHHGAIWATAISTSPSPRPTRSPRRCMIRSMRRSSTAPSSPAVRSVPNTGSD